MKIIGMIGSAVNLLLLALYYLEDGLGGLTARYGGEEFVTLIKLDDLNSITTLIEGIRTSIEAMQIKHEASSFGVVTVSIGYVVHAVNEIPLEDSVKPTADCLENFILKADQALYQAKENGRNQIKLFEE